MRILIVDDNLIFATALRRGLALRGHSCGVVCSLGDALRAMMENTFEAVLSDLHVGHESGIEVLRSAMKEAPDAVRVLMSGSSGDDRPHDARVVAHAELEKPFDLDLVCRILVDPKSGRDTCDADSIVTRDPSAV